MKTYLVVATATIATLLFLAPIAEMLFALAPYRIDEVRWRFGALGLISRSSLEPALGLFLMFVAAAWTGRRALLRALGVACLAGAALLLAMTGLFVLDALQARAPLNAAGQHAVAVAAMGGAVRFLLTTAALSVLGMCSWKAARQRNALGNPAVSLLMPRDGAPIAREPLR